MHKKLESDLMSLAHSILKMKNKKDVFALKQKSKEIYEKLSMLAFVEEYVNTTPNLKESKEELIEKVAQGFVSKDISIFEEATSNEVVEDGEKIVYDLADTPKEESEMEEILEQPFDELEEIKFSENETEHINEVIKIEVNKTKSLEEELQDIISVDVMADLFENAQPKSLNDKLVNNIQIGLNDRIIFVKNLIL